MSIQFDENEEVKKENLDEEKVEKNRHVEDEKNENILKELLEENLKIKESLMRKQADFENYRKRMVKEKEETVKFANTNLLLDIVSIIDDFERAIASGEESKDFDSFHKGITLIEKQFTSMLDKKWGLKRIDPVKEAFDPEKHEALMVEETVETKEPVVAEVFQNGYVLNSRIIRNAKVKVLMPVKNLEQKDMPDQGIKPEEK